MTKDLIIGLLGGFLFGVFTAAIVILLIIHLVRQKLERDYKHELERDYKHELERRKKHKEEIANRIASFLKQETEADPEVVKKLRFEDFQNADYDFCDSCQVWHFSPAKNYVIDLNLPRSAQDFDIIMTAYEKHNNQF